MDIRLATPADMDACAPFNAMMGTPDELPHKIQAQEIVLAEDGGQVVGYLRLEKVWNNFPFISWVHVEEAFRGKGAGTALMQFAARHQGGHTLLSSCKSDNGLSAAWHERLGFERCGLWQATHPDGCDEWFFKKTLKAAHG